MVNCTLPSGYQVNPVTVRDCSPIRFNMSCAVMTDHVWLSPDGVNWSDSGDDCHDAGLGTNEWTIPTARYDGTDQKLYLKTCLATAPTNCSYPTEVAITEWNKPESLMLYSVDVGTETVEDALDGLFGTYWQLVGAILAGLMMLGFFWYAVRYILKGMKL